MFDTEKIRRGISIAPSLSIPVPTCVLCVAAIVNMPFTLTMSILFVLYLVNMFRREQHGVDQIFFLFLL